MVSVMTQWDCSQGHYHILNFRLSLLLLDMLRTHRSSFERLSLDSWYNMVFSNGSNRGRSGGLLERPALSSQNFNRSSNSSKRVMSESISHVLESSIASIVLSMFCRSFLRTSQSFDLASGIVTLTSVVEGEDVARDIASCFRSFAGNWNQYLRSPGAMISDSVSHRVEVD